MTTELSTRTSPMAELQVFLRESTPALREALPPGIDVDRFKRTALTAASLQPELLNCDRKSLFLALVRCAGDGLIPDQREAVILPFKDHKAKRTTATYMPMIGGILKRCRNSGALATIAAHVVHQADRFAYVLGDQERIEHAPAIGGNRGPVIAAYAVATLKDGAVYREVMSVEEIEQARQVSRAADGPAWRNWYGEMSKKTVLRRLAKRLPSSADLDRMLGTETEVARALNPRPADALVGRPLPDDLTGETRQHQLDCDARAALSDAEDVEGLQLVWQGTIDAYRQAGLEVPLDVEAAWHDRREALKGTGGEA